MKTKITAILTFFAASVFAFAETAVEAPTAPETAPAPQVCAEQPKKCPKARPQISQEMREAFVQRILLSLSEEDLAKLAEKVDAVRKMTPEQKAEAIKALPKPEFRPAPQMKKFRGKPGCKFGPKGPKCNGPKCKGPKGPDFRGPKCGDKKMGKCHHGRRGPGPKFHGHRGHGPKAPGMKPCMCAKKGAPLPLPPAPEAPAAEAPVVE